MAGVSNASGTSKETVQEPLELIPETSLIELSNILLKDAPRSLPILGLVENLIRWRKNPNIPVDIKLYAPFGDFKNGTCVGIHDTDSFQGCIFYTKNAEELRDVLLTTDLFSWGINDRRHCMLLEIPEKLMSIVEEMTTKKNVKMRCDPTVHFWMEKEQALRLEVKCPPGVKLGPLTIDQIPYLDQYWPHHSDESQDYLKSLLERNFGIGVYVESNEMPVAWIVLNQNSCMAMLYTLEAYRRKGYAELVCNAMAKRLAEMDIHPRATVFENNRTSRMLFTKMGYNISHAVYYIHLKSET